MPKSVVPLNDTQVRALRPRDTRYSVSDGKGLILEVLPSGTKVWRFRYSLHGSRKPPVTIGSYADVSLKAARERARKYAELVAVGVSPVPVARMDRGTEKVADSVRECAALYLASEIAGKSEEYRRTTKRALDKDVLPSIGDKHINDVTSTDVLGICDRIKARGAPKMALHTRNVIKRMFEYAVARQIAKHNPASVIPARFIATSESRTRVLAPAEIGEMLRVIAKSDIRRPLRSALLLLVLLMVRKSELIEAEWTEFDLKASLWRIPGARMKMRAEHWVYLPKQAVAILEDLWEGRTSDRFVFPTVRGAIDRPIGKSTLNQAVKALGLKIEHFVLHDFRRTASTHLHEMGYSSDAIEKALAHKIKGIKGVYNRAEYSTERAKILQAWADFVDDQVKEDR